MATAFQQNAFQNNAFQISGGPPPIPPFMNAGDLRQLDMGVPFQSAMTYLGPTLGWVQSYVRPARVSMVSPVNVTSRHSVVFIGGVGPGPTIVNLPDVRAWMAEPNYQIYSPFERALWIKDAGGNAATFNIIIVPFGTQTIDGQLTMTIVMNRGIARLYPRNDLLGWYSG